MQTGSCHKPGKPPEAGREGVNQPRGSNWSKGCAAGSDWEEGWMGQLGEMS